MTKKRYYPNNWRAIRNAPDEIFDSLPFEDFMSWRADNWELPSSVFCLIREDNIETGKVKEYTYTNRTAARKKLIELCGNKDAEISVVTSNQFEFIPKEELNADE
tara:strand:- start:282 stop:596 length:315 start_codon:yes stop_codon:yes gene_type:complete